MSAFRTAATAARPGKRYTASTPPTAKPMKVAIVTAVSVTLRDSAMISRSCGSSVTICHKAEAKAWERSNIWRSLEHKERHQVQPEISAGDPGKEGGDQAYLPVGAKGDKDLVHTAKPLAGLASWVATEWRRLAWSGRPQPTEARTGGPSILARGSAPELSPRGASLTGTRFARFVNSLARSHVGPTFSSNFSI